MFLTIKLLTTFAKNTASHYLCITMKIKALCQRTNYPLNKIFMIYWRGITSTE